MSGARLILQADDFGMCDAVNDGIVAAFRAGTLTQASVMVPCPRFEGAAALAREHANPVGVHGTLTCEWDFLRWGPLTNGASLTEPDGTQHRTVDAAVEALDAGEAGAELIAQHTRLGAAGLTPVYIDCHMGPTSRDGYDVACRETGLPFLYPMIDASLHFDSIAMISPLPATDKKPWLLDRIAGFRSGTHLIVTHPAVDTPELREITRRDNENYEWAEPNRTSDLAVLLDPQVPRAIEAAGVELITAADV